MEQPRQDDRAVHWDGVYATRGDDVSWFQPHAGTSVRLLTAYADPGRPVVDVGAGASVLVDELVAAGWPDVTVLDVSEQALQAVRARLADARPQPTFLVTDLLSWQPDRRYGAWHDRAVLHFLVDPAQQERYVRTAVAAVEPGGVLVVGVFAEDGPTSCSGLPTVRFTAQALGGLFSDGFVLTHSEREEHHTPGGARQPFVWAVLRRR